MSLVKLAILVKKNINSSITSHMATQPVAVSRPDSIDLRKDKPEIIANAVSRLRGSSKDSSK